MAKTHPPTLDLTAEAVSGPDGSRVYSSADHFQAPPSALLDALADKLNCSAGDVFEKALQALAKANGIAGGQSCTAVQLDRLVSVDEVLRLTSWSRTSLYRKIAEETFPRPIKIGAARIAFRSSELTAWLDSRPRVYPHAA